MPATVSKADEGHKAGIATGTATDRPKIPVPPRRFERKRRV